MIVEVQDIVTPSRPDPSSLHLRNGAAIANRNTLIYLLINLRFLLRLRQGLHEGD